MAISPLFEICSRVAKRSAMIVMITRRADDVFGGTGGSSRGFRTWGSFPPCILRRVQVSPGLSARVPPGRLLSDLMLRLLASLSPFVALRFLPLPCVRFSPLRSSSLSRGVSPPFAFSASFPFLPFPSPSLRPVLSSSLQFSPRSDTGSSTDLSALVPSCFPSLPSPSFPFLASSSLRFSPLSSARISSGWFLCLGCVFPFFPLPCVQFFPVRLRFPQLPLSFLLLPSPSFPFLSSSSLRFSPLSSASFSRRLPAH